MADYRSKSYADGRNMQMESYYGYKPSSNPHDFRSYSVSYASSYEPPPTQMDGMKDSKPDYRSKSYADGRNMQMESYYGYKPSSNPHDCRSYSVSYASSYEPPPTQMDVMKDLKLKKGKSIGGFCTKSWSFNDPEFQRKKRVASYKVYSVEGKVKGSMRKSFRWLKDRYSQMVYGWR